MDKGEEARWAAEDGPERVGRQMSERLGDSDDEGSQDQSWTMSLKRAKQYEFDVSLKPPA